MATLIEEPEEKKVNHGAMALKEAEQFKKYIKSFLFQREKEFIVKFLQYLIAELREIHDQYYRPGKGEKNKND